MSTSTPAAGWYPDPSTPRALRWWNGSEWSDHRSPLPLPAPRPLTPGRRTSTPWIWAIAVGQPVLTLAYLAVFSAVFGSVFVEADADPGALNGIPTVLGTILGLWGIVLVMYGGTVAASALDRRALLVRGVDRPFHWAWSFLSSAVYPIGRAIVLRRRSATDWKAPLATWIVGEAIAVAGSTVMCIVLAIPLLARIADYGGY